jgi:hypothetical protein
MKNDDDREVSRGKTEERHFDRANDEGVAANLLTLLQTFEKWLS